MKGTKKVDKWGKVRTAEPSLNEDQRQLWNCNLPKALLPYFFLCSATPIIWAQFSSPVHLWAPIFLKLKRGITTHSQLEIWPQASALHGWVLLLRSLFLFWLQILWSAWFISPEGLVPSLFPLCALCSFILMDTQWALQTDSVLNPSILRNSIDLFLL